MSTAVSFTQYSHEAWRRRVIQLWDWTNFLIGYEDEVLNHYMEQHSWLLGRIYREETTPTTFKVLKQRNPTTSCNEPYYTGFEDVSTFTFIDFELENDTWQTPRDFKQPKRPSTPFAETTPRSPKASHRQTKGWAKRRR